MTRIKNLELRIKLFKNSLYIALFCILAALFLSTKTFAAETTPSADIKSKLEELKKQIASKAAKLKQEIKRKLNNKAYIGKVQTKSDTSLTLITDSGPKIVSINQDTVFESEIKSKQKFSKKTLSSGDFLAALGDADEIGVLTAKKLILYPAPTNEPKTPLWGQIISVSDELITLKDKELKNIAVSLPKFTKVNPNDFVILTGNKDKDNVFKAGFIYVIPSPSILKPKKTATPSAKVSTPSTKIKPASR